MSQYQNNELQKRFLLNNGVLTPQVLGPVWEQLGNHEQSLTQVLIQKGFITPKQAQDIEKNVQMYRQLMSNAQAPDPGIQQDAVPTARVHSEQVPAVIKQITQLSSDDFAPTINMTSNELLAAQQQASKEISKDPSFRFPSNEDGSQENFAQTKKSSKPPIFMPDSEKVQAKDKNLQDWLDSNRDDLPKTIGPYKIHSQLGLGGMSVVYEASLSEGSEPIALKVLSRKGVMKTGGSQRFQQEASIIRRLRHPNIVRVFDAHFTEELSYIAMERLDRGSLENRLRKDGPFAVREAISICEKVARALHHAHEQKIVHRDLKPANILITASGEPVVVDFGVAKLREMTQDAVLSKQGEILGTPGYMSPEQADGRLDEVDSRSDVYSLGATLYALLSGEAPFTGGSVAKILTAVISTKPRSLQGIRPDVPKDIERAILRCLEKEPENRFQSCEDFAVLLEDWLNNNLSDSALDRPPLQLLEERSANAAAPSKSGYVFAALAVLFFALFLWSEFRHSGSSSETQTPKKTQDPDLENKLRAEWDKKQSLKTLEHCQFLLRPEFRDSLRYIGSASARNSTLKQLRLECARMEKSLNLAALSKEEFNSYAQFLLNLSEFELNVLQSDFDSFNHSKYTLKRLEDCVAAATKNWAKLRSTTLLQALFYKQRGIYKHLTRDDFGAQEDYSKAFEFFEKAGQSRDQQALLKLYLSQVLSRNKSHPEALAALKVANTLIDPKALQTRLVRENRDLLSTALIALDIDREQAFAFAQVGQTKDAKSNLQRAINRGNELAALNNRSPRLILARIYKTRSALFIRDETRSSLLDIDNAQREISLVKGSHPYHSDAQHFFSSILVQAGDSILEYTARPQDSLALLERALSIRNELLSSDEQNIAYVIEAAINEYCISRAYRLWRKQGVNNDKTSRGEVDSLRRCRDYLELLSKNLPKTMMPPGTLSSQIEALKDYQESPPVFDDCRRLLKP